MRLFTVILLICSAYAVIDRTTFQFAVGDVDTSSLTYTKLVLMGRGVSNWIAYNPGTTFTSSSFNDYNLVASRYAFYIPKDGNITYLCSSLDIGTGSIGLTNGLVYTFYLYKSTSSNTGGTLATSNSYTEIGQQSMTLGALSASLYKTFTKCSTFSTPLAVSAGDRIVPALRAALNGANQPGFVGVAGGVGYSFNI